MRLGLIVCAVMLDVRCPARAPVPPGPSPRRARHRRSPGSPRHRRPHRMTTDGRRHRCCSTSAACSSTSVASGRCASSPGSRATTSCGADGSPAGGSAASSAAGARPRTSRPASSSDWDLPITPDEFLDGFGNWLGGPLAGSDELVGAVRSLVPVGCLSNTNSLHWDQHFSQWPLLDTFDHRFLSFELGMLKPDREVFDRVAELLAVPTEPHPVPRRQRAQRRRRHRGRVPGPSTSAA